MAEKRYWWLKLPEDFFGSKRVKRLRKEDDGDTLLIIYLKLQLLAIRDDGIIRFAALETSFEDELALDTEESPENIRRCLDYLIRNGLAEQPDESTLFFPWALENTGSEGASAARMRAVRQRLGRGQDPANNVTQTRHIVTDPEAHNVTQIRHNVTEEAHNVTPIRHNVQDIDKEIELEVKGETDTETLYSVPLDGRKDMPAPPNCEQGFAQGNTQSFQQTLERYSGDLALPADNRPDWLKRVDELAAEGEAIVDAALVRQSTGRGRYF